MAAPSFTNGQVLTGTELDQLADMVTYPDAVAAGVNPCVAGTLYLITNGSSNFTFDLPSPTAGICIAFKKVDSGAGGNTITASSGVILGPGCGSGGASSIPVSALGANVELMADGTNWHIIGGAQDSGWLAFSYSNSWVSNSGPGAAGTVAGYRITGNIVRLGGSIKTGASGSAPCTALPVGYRPLAAVAMTVNPYGAAGSASFTVSTAGVTAAFYSAGTGVNLDGATYTVD
jgi:hypothetical protein